MESFENLIKNNKSFALFCHINPDADALGSMNALSMALTKLKKRVYMFCDSDISEGLEFLGVKLEKDEKIIDNCDVCVMMDCNSLDRIGKYGEAFNRVKLRVNIDHHQKENYKFDISFADKTQPSTADIVYELLKTLNVKITKEMAQNLYAGLSSDTGCFMHQNTTAVSHLHAFELMQYNFDLQETNYQLFKFKEHSHLKFYKMAMRNTHGLLGGKLFLTVFKHKDYVRFKSFCDNSANFQIFDGIDGNELRIRITEKKNGFCTISMRSNKYVNVCDLARKFGGGGHIRASGATFTGKLSDIKKQLILEAEKVLKK